MKYVEQIKKILRGFWAPFNSSNAKVIFLCLISAFIFWLFNALNKDYTTRIDQPLSFIYDRDSLISVNDLPKKISLNVTGGGWNLLRKTLGFNSAPLVVNLENPTTIKYLTQYNLLNIASDQLDELDVNFVISDTIYIDIDRKISKTFFVDVDSSSVDLIENYFITSKINVNPDSATLTGPASIIKGLPNKLSLTVPDTQIDGDFDEDVAVKLSVAGPIESIPEKVNVNFQVGEFESKTSKIRFTKVNFPENKKIRLSRSAVEITYMLPVSRKGVLDTANFSVVADYKKFNRKDSTIEVVIEHCPAYLRKLELVTPEVKLISQ